MTTNYTFAKHLDFYENFDFWKIIRFWQKIRFLTKNSIFDKEFAFWQKIRFLTKNSIFDKEFDLWQRIHFLTKHSIFDKEYDFWQRIRFLTNKKFQKLWTSGSELFLDQKWKWWVKEGTPVWAQVVQYCSPNSSANVRHDTFNKNIGVNYAESMTHHYASNQKHAFHSKKNTKFSQKLLLLSIKKHLFLRKKIFYEIFCSVQNYESYFANFNKW